MINFAFNAITCKMEDINRLKVVLAEKKRTNSWLASELGKNPATVSKWCTNSSQPDLPTLKRLLNCLKLTLKTYCGLQKNKLWLKRKTLMSTCLNC